MNNKIEFLKKRKRGIGGSDVSAILPGYKSFRTAVEIWNDKINPDIEEVILKPRGSTASMFWGNALEDSIVKEYALDTGNNVTSKNKDGNALDQRQHDKYPWLIANVDGIAHTKEHGDIVLEVKCWSFDPNEEWGDHGTDNIPVQYLLQVQHYMNVLNMPMAHVAFLKGGHDFRIFKIPRSDKIIDGMHEKLKSFWFDNVKAGIPPEAEDLSDVRLIYKESTSKDKEATDEQIKAINKIRRTRGRISRLEKILKKRKAKVGEYMGECGKLVTFNGASNETLATFNANKNGTRVFSVPK